MYTINHATGVVTRDLDGAVCAPAQSTDDPNFVEFSLWVLDGNEPTAVNTPPFDPEAYQAAAVQAVQAALDLAAQARGYDGILSACSYAVSSHPRFGPEGQAFVAWRDAVWEHCYDVLAQVSAGQRTVPSVPDLLAELPALALP